VKYLLDTNTCVRYLNGRAPNVRTRLRSEVPADIAVCSIVKAELFYGSMRSQNPQRSIAQQRVFLDQFASLPFDDNCAEHYSRIRAHLAAAGTPIGPNDLMIAAIALAHNLTLVTHNSGEFGRVPGLLIEDWEI
jgi:tRNA(fMet)-specific endonuclease VapC